MVYNLQWAPLIKKSIIDNYLLCSSFFEANPLRNSTKIGLISDFRVIVQSYFYMGTIIPIYKALWWALVFLMMKKNVALMIAIKSEPQNLVEKIASLRKSAFDLRCKIWDVE